MEGPVDGGHGFWVCVALALGQWRALAHALGVNVLLKRTLEQENVTFLQAHENK